MALVALTELKRLLCIGDSGQDDLLNTFLTLSAQTILNRIYPFDESKSTVPTRWVAKQVEIAVYLWGKRGAEGQTNHAENGINRTYESGDIPESMLKDILPLVGGFIE